VVFLGLSKLLFQAGAFLGQGLAFGLKSLISGLESFELAELIANKSEVVEQPGRAESVA
jgi:hypothetical protein